MLYTRVSMSSGGESRQVAHARCPLMGRLTKWEFSRGANRHWGKSSAKPKRRQWGVHFPCGLELVLHHCTPALRTRSNRRCPRTQTDTGRPSAATVVDNSLRNLHPHLHLHLHLLFHLTIALGVTALPSSSSRASLPIKPHGSSLLAVSSR